MIHILTVRRPLPVETCLTSSDLEDGLPYHLLVLASTLEILAKILRYVRMGVATAYWATDAN